jgi:flagellin
MINTNIVSLNAQRNLSSSQTSLATSMQRLSSGLRINSAKDDAAGLAISQRLTSQIGGLNQAARNANDGISLMQTAEGDLTQIGNNLQRIRDLAVQASNATNSASDRAAINNESNQLISEINRVAGSSNFNGVNLLDGTFANQNFQVGANGTSNDQITIGAIASAKSSSLGVGSSSGYSSTVTGSASTANAMGAGDLTLNGFNVGASSSDGVSYKDSSASAIAKAAAINAASATTGVTATTQANTVAGTAVTSFAAIAAGDIKINGVDLGPLAITTTAAERGAQMTAAVNSKSSQTGVTATFNSTTGAVSLAAADGRNITLEKAATVTSDDANTGLTTGSLTAVAFSKTAVAQVKLSSTTENGITVANGSGTQVTGGAAATTGIALAAGDLTINGVDVGVVTGGTSLSVQGQNMADAINKISSSSGVTASSTALGVLTLTSISGAAIKLDGVTAKGLSAAGLTNTTGGVTTAKSAGVGATSAGVAVGAATVTTTVGAGVSSLDLTTASGATAALATIDAALASINNSRASLGAYQNRFSSAVTSLQTSAENFTASRSRIQDADFAQETANLTRGQVLQQAGTAILAQANALPQGVLALLR